ncbi:MAG: hypothetical protein IJ447_00120 [Clostridia bacterium]|nr:hypothetical protein [Clostridia bacterium]
MRKRKIDIKFIREILLDFLFIVVPFILFVFVFMFFEDLGAILIRQFADTELFYVFIDVSVFNILFYVFYILSMLLFGSLICSSFGKKHKPFKTFISEKNHRNLIVLLCLFVSLTVSFISFFPMCEYNFAADDKSYKHSTLFHKNEIVFDYESVNSVRVYVFEEMDAKLHGSSYEVYIDISADTTYTFVPEGFGYKFENMYNLLSKIDKDKITFDTTDVEYAFKSNKEQDKYLQQMIDEYS